MLKNVCGKVIFGVPEIPPLLGVLGAWMTFKKAEMAKTLRNRLSMIEGDRFKTAVKKEASKTLRWFSKGLFM